MDVRAFGQIINPDLYYRPYHYKVPVGPQICDRLKQRDIQPFIDHSDKTYPRVRDAGLLNNVLADISRLAKMLGVNARGKSIYRTVLGPLCLIQAVPTRKNQVGKLK
jgi:hypothetical protein